MNTTNRKVIRLFFFTLLFLGIFIFAISYEREFRENNYKFDFSNMQNPEQSLIVVIISMIFIVLTFTNTKKAEK
jgi:hypothetical protein